MLSFKLKRLCSSVIASLSAIGVFSFENAARGATDGLTSKVGSDIEYGTKFKYDVVNSVKLSANMSQVTCSTKLSANSSVESHITRGVYTAPNVTNGESGYCTYTCANGYLSRGKGNTTFTVGTTTGVSTVYAGVACEPVCDLGSGANIASATYTAPISDTETGYCDYKCKDSYVVFDASGVAQTGFKEFVTGTTGVGGVVYVRGFVIPQQACVPDTLECEAPGASNTYNLVNKKGEAVEKENAYVCKYECMSGYSMMGGTNTTSFVTGSITGVADSYTPAEAGVVGCRARSFSLTYDCGSAATLYKGGAKQSNSSGSVTVSYGSDVTVDHWCQRSDYLFKGWRYNY